MDSRDIHSGSPIPALRYCDQPHLQILNDGSWLVVLTTSGHDEGARDQHLRAYRSRDEGASWEGPVRIEEDETREASYGSLLKAPSGRIFCFYNFNTQSIRTAPAEGAYYPSGFTSRVDCLGDYVFRWSDDGGTTWSKERVVIPAREFEIDRLNSFEGKVRLFWNAGKPTASGGRALVPLTKVERFGDPFYVRSEGVVLCSDDLFLLDDPSKASWQTYPEGCHGIRWGGKEEEAVNEEHSLSLITDNVLLDTFRTKQGVAAAAYSFDNGVSWTKGGPLRFWNGHELRHPQANLPTWRLSDGRILLWFHSEGSRDARKRNPVWLAVGEFNGREVVFGEPEIALYDLDHATRISYPDFAERGGAWVLTETQKVIARSHHLSPELRKALMGETIVPEPAWQKEAPADASAGRRDVPRTTEPSGVEGFTATISFETNHLTQPLSLITSAEPVPSFEVRYNERAEIEVRFEGVTSLVASLPSGKNILSLAFDRKPGIVLLILNGSLAAGGWAWLPEHSRSNPLPSAFQFADATSTAKLWNEALRVNVISQSHRNLID